MTGHEIPDEIAEAVERAVFDAWAVREGDRPTADSSWWHIHRSGPTHTKWAADAALAAAVPLIREQIARDIEAQEPHSGGSQQFNRGVRYARYQAASIARGGAS